MYEVVDGMHPLPCGCGSISRDRGRPVVTVRANRSHSASQVPNAAVDVREHDVLLIKLAHADGFVELVDIGGCDHLPALLHQLRCVQQRSSSHEGGSCVVF